MDPTTIARAVLGGLIADAERVDAEVVAVQRWIDDNADRVGPNVVAWTASRSIAMGLEALDEGTATGHERTVLTAFRSMPVVTQVAVALSEFAGLDDETVARALSLPVAEVAALLDSIGGTPPTAPAPLPDTGVIAAAAPSSPPPEPPTSRLASPPPAPPPAVTVVHPSGSRRGRRHPPSRPGSHSSRPRWWVITAVVVVGLVVAGLGVSSARDDTSSSPSPSDADLDRPSSGLVDAATVRRDQMSQGCSTADGDRAIDPVTRETTVRDEPRQYRLTAPAPITPGNPRPLVVDLGDLGQDIAQHVAETRLDDLARALSIVVATATPSAGFPQWNVTGAPDDPDDLGLVDRIIADQTAELCIDQTRIILAGRGAGAHLAAAYACSHPGAVSALILIAGVDHPTPCPTPRRLSILAVLGENDDVYPLSGGNAPTFTDSFGDQLRPGSRYAPEAPPAALDDWARTLDCVGSANQQIGFVAARINTSCARDGEVWRIVIPGFGHEWFPATYDLIVQFLTTGPFRLG